MDEVKAQNAKRQWNLSVGGVTVVVEAAAAVRIAVRCSLATDVGVVFVEDKDCAVVVAAVVVDPGVVLVVVVPDNNSAHTGPGSAVAQAVGLAWYYEVGCWGCWVVVFSHCPWYDVDGL